MNEKWHIPSILRMQGIIWDNLTAPIRHVEVNQWRGGYTYWHLPYARGSSSQWLNLYVPASVEPVPLLVLVHGGGFVINDAESHQVQLFYRYFREKGYACATINYRLAGEAPYPAALEDVKAALRFLGQHGDQYGYDTRRVALWGESAGAYLAVMAAYSAAEEYSRERCEGETESNLFPPLPLAAVVDFYGPADVTAQEGQFLAAGVPRMIRRLANGWLTRHIGGFSSAEECWMGKPHESWTGSEYESFVPCRRVAARTCPHPGLRTLLVHGQADLTVAPAQSEQLCRVLQQTYGTPAARLLPVPHRKHADDRLYDPAVLNLVLDFLHECGVS